MAEVHANTNNSSKHQKTQQTEEKKVSIDFTKIPVTNHEFAVEKRKHQDVMKDSSGNEKA